VVCFFLFYSAKAFFFAGMSFKISAKREIDIRKGKKRKGNKCQLPLENWNVLKHDEHIIKYINP